MYGTNVTDVGHSLFALFRAAKTGSLPCAITIRRHPGPLKTFLPTAGE